MRGSFWCGGVGELLVLGGWGAGAQALRPYITKSSSSPKASPEPHPLRSSAPLRQKPLWAHWLDANDGAMTWIRGDGGFVVKADFLQGSFYIKGVIVITPRFGAFHQDK